MEDRVHLISVRKLAAMDIVFHGSRLIMVEFTVGMLLTGFLGLFFLYRGFTPGSYPSLMVIILVCALLGIGLNYLPLLVYAFMISRQKSVQNEVTSELAHPEIYRKMYGLQSMILILAPFALLILAIFQVAQ